MPSMSERKSIYSKVQVEKKTASLWGCFLLLIGLQNYYLINFTSSVFIALC